VRVLDIRWTGSASDALAGTTDAEAA